jgi:anaerobic selenocysteine-containing dehydrogenase
MEEFITACPRNCCSTCTFRVQVENNRIRRILPYRENLATPEGPCIKGLSYIERAHSPDRIIHPLIRNSKGEFRHVTIIAVSFIFMTGELIDRILFYHDFEPVTIASVFKR